jgi:hypothetical protein
MQASGVDDIPAKLPVETRCKTVRLGDANPDGAAPATIGRLPSGGDLTLPAAESNANSSYWSFVICLKPMTNDQ